MIRKFVTVFVLLTSLSISSVQAVCEGPVGMNEGDCAPEFVLKSEDGKDFRLSDQKGKVIFLHFWATWCPPCEEELVSMESANRSLKSKPFQMVAVSIDEDGWIAVRPFLQKLFRGTSPSFLVFTDKNQKVAQSYGTFKVPETFIIDTHGRIVDKVQGTKEWRDPMILHYLELLGKS